MVLVVLFTESIMLFFRHDFLVTLGKVVNHSLKIYFSSSGNNSCYVFLRESLLLKFYRCYYNSSITEDEPS